MSAFAPLSATVPINACETVSGEYVDVVEPLADTIKLTDIAWALSRQARFAGHTMSEEIWSVAQHADFVVDLIEMAFDGEQSIDSASFSLWLSLHDWMDRRGFAENFLKKQFSVRTTLLGGLHHDDTEAYLIDLPSPVKRHEALREPYKALEKRLHSTIWSALGLPQLTEVEHAIVVWADLMALQIEAGVLMPSRGRGWSGDMPDIEMLHLHLFPAQIKNWRLAYSAFLETHARLSTLKD